ncbi:MAG: hypothetical protein KBS38_01530, partial [Bacteroidales bacterium]|nr:hypothetical protein [Candidatus Cacconaster caballi]
PDLALVAPQILTAGRREKFRFRTHFPGRGLPAAGVESSPPCCQRRDFIQGGRSSASGRISPEGACLRPEWNLLRLAACGENSSDAGLDDLTFVKKSLIMRKF